MPASYNPNNAADQKAAARLRDRGWLVLGSQLATSCTPRSLEDRLRPAIAEATRWMMAALGRERAGRDLPPMTWRQYETGYRVSVHGLTVTRGPQALADLESWAGALGLQRRDDPADPGTVQFAGEVDGREVRVWGIVDDVAYRARTYPWHPAGDKVRQLRQVEEDGGRPDGQ